MVDPNIVKTQIAFVRKTVGKKHLSWATSRFIEGLEKDLSSGRGVTRRELVMLMNCMKKDLAFKNRK